jgi:solute:Na+ symporter, SSS family
VLNSSSTVFTMDIFRPVCGQRASDRLLVSVGRWSAFAILAMATVVALYLTRGTHSIFILIQDVGAWVAAPIAVVFLTGVLWKRATSTAATFTLCFGCPFTWLVQYVLFKRVAWLMPFDNWLNRTFLVWLTCQVLMIVLSLVTRPPGREQTEGIIWSWSYAQLPPEERKKYRGLRSLTLWWGTLMAVTLFLNGYVLWFQFWGPR